MSLSSPCSIETAVGPVSLFSIPLSFHFFPWRSWYFLREFPNLFPDSHSVPVVGDREDIFNSSFVIFFPLAWSRCGLVEAAIFGFDCVSPLHQSIFYRYLSPASLVSSSFEFIDVIFFFFPYLFFCVFVHLSSVKFTPHFILEEGPLVACPPFFFLSFTVNVRHVCLIFVVSFSHSNLSYFFIYPAFPSISFSTCHFHHFIFTFKCFIFFCFHSPTLAHHFQRFTFVISFSHLNISFFLFSLAHQSYTSRRTSHSFSFHSFIQPHSNTSFNSIHLVHFVSSGLPRLLLPPISLIHFLW